MTIDNSNNINNTKIHISLRTNRIIYDCVQLSRNLLFPITAVVWDEIRAYRYLESSQAIRIRIYCTTRGVPSWIYLPTIYHFIFSNAIFIFIGDQIGNTLTIWTSFSFPACRKLKSVGKWQKVEAVVMFWWFFLLYYPILPKLPQSIINHVSI